MQKITSLIPFNRPSATGKEFEYIQQAVANGHTAGDGQFTRKCSRLLKEELDVHKVLLTTSCTHAIEMMALLLDLQPDDEVIVPSFTFVSTLNPFVLRGAKPVFVDIRPDTLNMDETQIEKHITSKTKAIVPVHYAGVGCEMDSILSIAAKYNLTVLEDNAHGLFGRYKGKPLGTFGTMAAQSFHDTKNFSCGEGGALLINDPFYMDRAEIMREKGTDRSRFLRGQVDKYTWVDVGSSYLPSDMLAAYLYAQLEQRQQIQAKRQQIWQYYYEHLQDWAEAQNVQLPTVPAHCDQAYHLFYLLMPSLEQRQNLIEHLKAQGISSVFHYLPLHLSQMGRQFGGQTGNCPVTESTSDRLLRLPFFNSFTEAEQARVVAAIQSFRCQPSIHLLASRMQMNRLNAAVL